MQTVYVALGSNQGDSRRILLEAFAALQGLSATPVGRSSLWRSAPVDCPDGSPDFLNAVAALAPLPGETPESLLGKLQRLETEFGRRPKRAPNEPRPLDLDLLVFGTETRNTRELTLPHPRAHLRRFVLEPLCELAPDLVLPGQSACVRALLESLQGTGCVARLLKAAG